MSSDKDKPKIVTDDDWKAEAKKEKAKLSEEKKQEQSTGKTGTGRSAGPMPPANFVTLANSLALQALLYMGRIGDPNSAETQRMVNLDMAKHHIDLLGILEEKTKGNLTDEESQALSLAMHEVRMQYVQVAAV